MKIEIIKKNEDGTAVVKLEQVEKANETIDGFEDKLSTQFSAGFAKGTEKGKKTAQSEFLSKVDFLDIDPNDFDGSVKTAKELFTKLKSGQASGNEQLKDLQKQLDTKSSAYDKLKTDFESFRKTTLIDDKLKSLAAEHKAVNPGQIPILFKNEFNIELDENGGIAIKKQDGSPIFNQDGNPRDISDLFTNVFKSANPHLFEANGNNGSGGGGAGTTDFSGIKSVKDFKNDSDRVKFIKENGVEAYQTLINNSLTQ